MTLARRVSRLETVRGGRSSDLFADVVAVLDALARAKAGGDPSAQPALDMLARVRG